MKKWDCSSIWVFSKKESMTLERKLELERDNFDNWLVSSLWCPILKKQDLCFIIIIQNYMLSYFICGGSSLDFLFTEVYFLWFGMWAIALVFDAFRGLWIGIICWVKVKFHFRRAVWCNLSFLCKISNQIIFFWIMLRN